MSKTIIMNKTRYIVLVIFLLLSSFFLIDPFNWWPYIEVGTPCLPDSLRPTCTGKIIFPWQRP